MNGIVNGFTGRPWSGLRISLLVEALNGLEKGKIVK